MSDIREEIRAITYKIQQKYKSIAYVMIGALGIYFVVWAIGNGEHRAALILNLGTEFIGASLIFLALRYLLLEDDNTSNKPYSMCGISSKGTLEKDKQEIWHKITHAKKTIWISGLTLESVLRILVANNAEFLRNKIEAGCQFRFLMIVPNVANTAPAPEIAEYLGERPGRITETSSDWLRRLGKLPDECKAHIEIRAFKHQPSVGYFIVDAESVKDGFMTVSPYLYHKSGDESPMFIILQQENRAWFDFYREHFEEIWHESVEIEF